MKAIFRTLSVGIALASSIFSAAAGTAIAKIKLVEYPPVSIGRGQSVTIEAQIAAASGQDLRKAVLYYGTQWNNPTTPIELVSGADGIFRATIPGMVADGQVVRFYLTAESSSGTVERLPKFNDYKKDDLTGQPLLDSAGNPMPTGEEYFGYVVETSRASSHLPIIDIYVKDQVAAFSANGTFGAMRFGDEFYERVKFSLHGQTSAASRYFLKRSLNVDLPKDHGLSFPPLEKRLKDINLITNFADKSKVRNTLAYGASQDAGTPASYVKIVRVNINGKFAGLYDLVEEVDDRRLTRAGLDKNGALYKVYTGSNFISKAKKRTRENESMEDLAALEAGVSQSSKGAVKSFVYDNIDIAAMTNYLASMVVTGGTDCCHKNFFLYRDSDKTQLWQFLPWDLDLTFGRSYVPGSAGYFSDTLVTTDPMYVGESNNIIIGALYQDDRFRKSYQRRVRTLVDRFLATDYYEKRLDQLKSDLEGDAEDDDALWDNKAGASWEPDMRSAWIVNRDWEKQLSYIRDTYLPERRKFIFKKLAKNGSIPGPQSQADESAVAVSAVDVRNPEGQYIAVKNSSKVAVDVSEWNLSGSIQYKMRPGTVIPAGETLYLCRDVKGFAKRKSGPSSGQRLFIQGNFNSELPATSGNLTLSTPNSEVTSYFSW